MCHRYRRVKGEEELGRLSRGGSSSSSSLLLSIPSPGLALLEGCFFFFTLPSSHTEWIHVHLYICHPQQADTGKERHPELVTPISLAEGRQEQIRPTRLTRFCLVFFGWIFLFFLLLSTAFYKCCQLRK